jgi:hypothetical protein
LFCNDPTSKVDLQTRLPTLSHVRFHPQHFSLHSGPTLTLPHMSSGELHFTYIATCDAFSKETLPRHCKTGMCTTPSNSQPCRFRSNLWSQMIKRGLVFRWVSIHSKSLTHTLLTTVPECTYIQICSVCYSRSIFSYSIFGPVYENQHIFS